MAPRHENRLAKETSPYLLQHARNPVDWYPWGEEAFAKARSEDRPVFLSIGYSTCHWCHVMERESFEDEEIAAFLNAHYVAIKVDREERPDVDAIYMTAIQAAGQGGGWPLSAFLDHGRRPFLLGTYFPPDDRHGRPGFLSVLRKIREAWTERRADVDRAGGEFADAVRHAFGTPEPALLTEETLSKGVRQFASRFDAARGGFGEAPKFPRGHSLSFLLEAGERKGLADARTMALATLRAMARGGMYDQAGGGFHRYSTDGAWLVPHFEKMLYDQALLVPAYVDAFLLTGEAEFARTARETLDYCLRDLRHAEGGFFCAEDADSEGVEGKFYLWTEREIREVLGKDADAALKALGARSSGNFHGEAEEAPEGANILHRPGPEEIPDAWKAALLAARSKRVRPHLDDKVLAAWNGLAIAAFARAGRALGEARYVEAAGRAADFVLASMRRPDGRLLRTWRDGKGGGPGFLDDHAFMALALLDLYESTGEPRRLEQSLDLARTMLALFAEDGEGALYDAGRDSPDLLARTREGDDWAVPSGNSGAALLLLRLGRLAGDGALEARGREILRAFSGALDGMPLGAPAMLRALDFDLGPTTEVVIAGDPSTEEFRALERVLSRSFRARLSVARKHPGADGERMARTLPWLAAFGSADGSPSAALCRGGTCSAPVSTAAALRDLLDR